MAVERDAGGKAAFPAAPGDVDMLVDEAGDYPAAPRVDYPRAGIGKIDMGADIRNLAAAEENIPQAHGGGRVDICVFDEYEDNGIIPSGGDFTAIITCFCALR